MIQAVKVVSEVFGVIRDADTRHFISRVDTLCVCSIDESFNPGEEDDDIAEE